MLYTKCYNPFSNTEIQYENFQVCGVRGAIDNIKQARGMPSARSGARNAREGPPEQTSEKHECGSHAESCREKAPEGTVCAKF